MGKYSTQKDIQDELIRQYSKRSDHEEAEEYVDKVLLKLSIDPSKVTVTPMLKRLSAAYATYKRAFYESKTKDDIFYQIYIGYERELRDLTADIIKFIKGDQKPMTKKCKNCKSWECDKNTMESTPEKEIFHHFGECNNIKITIRHYTNMEDNDAMCIYTTTPDSFPRHRTGENFGCVHFN